MSRNSPSRNSHHHHHPTGNNQTPAIRRLEFDDIDSPSTSHTSYSKSTTTTTKHTLSSKDIGAFESSEDCEVVHDSTNQNSATNHRSSNLPQGTSQHYYSCSSGYDSEDRLKTDYTYAKSPSYRRDVDIHKKVDIPNMSRVALYKHQHAVRTSSYDEEEDDVASVSSKSSTKRSHRNHKNPINGIHYASEASSRVSLLHRYWSSFISIFSTSISYIRSCFSRREVSQSESFNSYSQYKKSKRSKKGCSLWLLLLVPILLASGFYFAKPYLVTENGSYVDYLFSPFTRVVINSSNPEELKDLVKLLIQQELKSHSKFSEIDASLYNIKDTIKGLVEEGDNLAMRTRLEAGHREGRDEKTQEQFKKLDQQLDQLQSLALELKNCCRNESSHQQAVDERILLFFHKLLNQDNNSEVLGKLAQWLKTYNEGDSKKKMTSFKEAIVKEILEQMAVKTDNYSLPDDLEALIWKKVQQALSQYDADKTGRADYALESGGGSIVGTRCTETYVDKDAEFSVFGIPIWQKTTSPRTVIQPGVSPGQCWAFRGSQGYIVIRLSTAIIPTAFSVEHIPVSLSPFGKIDSAPKDFIVLGLISESDTEGVVLGNYTYDADAEPLQTFDVQMSSSGVFRYIELRIESNHGNLEYTCLYRFRVHGHRAYK